MKVSIFNIVVGDIVPLRIGDQVSYMILIHCFAINYVQSDENLKYCFFPFASLRSLLMES